MLPHLGKIENNQGTVDNLPNWLWIWGLDYLESSI